MEKSVWFYWQKDTVNVDDLQPCKKAMHQLFVISAKMHEFFDNLKKIRGTPESINNILEDKIVIFIVALRRTINFYKINFINFVQRGFNIYCFIKAKSLKSTNKS